MLDFSVSVIPLVALAAANFVLSWVWYSPVLFAKPWLKALGWSLDMEMTDEDRKQMPWLFFSGVIHSLLFVYGLMVVVHGLKITDFAQGLVVGAVIWAAFVLTHSISTLWEGRKAVVIVINNGLFLLTYALFGGILAVWR